MASDCPESFVDATGDRPCTKHDPKRCDDTSHMLTHLDIFSSSNIQLLTTQFTAIPLIAEID
jgi:hypothetical protein